MLNSKLDSNKLWVGIIGSASFSAIFSILLSIVIARILSVEDRGAFQLFVTNILIVSSITTGGVGYALGICIKKGYYKKWYSMVVIYIFYSFLVGYIFSYLFYDNLSPLIISLGIVCSSITLITFEKSNIDYSMRLYKVLLILQPFLGLIIFGSLYLGIKKISFHSAIICQLMIYFILSLISIYFLFLLSGKFDNYKDSITFKFFFSHWVKQNIFQSIGILLANFDKYLIAFWLGDYILGLYAIFIAFDGLLSRLFLPAANYYYSGLWNKENRLLQILLIVISASIFFIFIVYIFGNSLISSFFGEDYLGVNYILPYLLFSSVISGVSWILAQNVLIVGKQIALIIRQLFSLMIFSVIFYLLRDLGLNGIMISLLSASVTRLIFSLYYYFLYPIDKYYA